MKPLLLLVLLASAPVQAGPFSDELGKCLVASTTSTDKNALVKWMFSTAAHQAGVNGIKWSRVSLRE